MAYDHGTSIDTPFLKFVRMVQKLYDVFPMDLLGVFLDRDSDFSFLMSGTKTISIPPYMIDLTMSIDKLHDLLSKGFITSSVSLGCLCVL